MRECLWMSGPDISSASRFTPLSVHYTSCYCGAELLTCSDCAISITVSRHLVLEHVFHHVVLYLRLRISDVLSEYQSNICGLGNEPNYI